MLTVYLYLLFLLFLIIIYYKNHKQEYFSSNYQIHCYCINLKDNMERWNKIVEEQKKVSFEIKRLEAIDTRNDKWKNYSNMLNEETKIKLEEAIKNKIRLTHADLTQGAIGCFLSHLEIYKKIANNHNDKDYILIIEDDNVFTDNFEQNLQLAINRAPKDFDILSFSHSNIRSHKIENNPYYRLAEKYYLLNCYLINKKGAEKFLKNFTTVDKQIDSYLSDLAKQKLLNIYLYNEQLSYQARQDDSNIQIYKTINKSYK